MALILRNDCPPFELLVNVCVLLRLDLKGKSEVHASGICLDDECWRLYEQKVHSLLNQGLNNRAKLIRVTWRNTLSDCSIENGFSILDREPLLVGVSVSSMKNAFRVVDIGPNAENKEEALKFRKFWGEKAELRRFKDGTIAESTVWESEHWNRHLILKRIAEYVLLRHLSLSKESIVHIMDQLDFSLLHGVRDPISFSGSLLEALEVLSKRLRLIQGIPLKVSSVQPLDPAFRFTSVFPPEPHPLAIDKGDVPRLQKLMPSCIQPLEVMIQLEGSGNWPMDDIAIEKTKTAFLLKIGESLQNSWGMTCTATEDDVDVFMSGYVFRLKIWHERGLSLLKREDGSDQFKWNNFMLTRKGYEENKQNVSAAMFLATAYDKASEAWTRFSPNVSELKRLVAYARSSASLLNKLILQDQIDSYKWECLLRTPLNNYDAVILLHRDKLPYPQRLLFPSELNQGKHVARGNASKVFQPFMSPGDFKGSLEELKNKLLVNFDPLRFFFGDLEKEFSNMFKVWYDSLGGDAIGITWDRFSSKKRGGEEGEDPVDILKSVGQFGKGFVRSVYSLKSPRLMN
ncbi:hypothetical protein SO802_009631 [Lithocarpus litseifolius]|uniref:Uncharacterized protein n=1 Tax=Lithocarpus litseifolius TaxID=425828 RepID=A0AAW2DD07_9ROSI